MRVPSRGEVVVVEHKKKKKASLLLRFSTSTRHVSHRFADQVVERKRNEIGAEQGGRARGVMSVRWHATSHIIGRVDGAVVAHARKSVSRRRFDLSRFAGFNRARASPSY